MHRTPDFEPLTFPQRGLILFYLAVAAFYLVWRFTTLNPEALAFSWLVYGAEIYGVLTMVMHVIMNWRLSVRTPPPAPEGLGVDVFVPTYNEPESVVRRTLLACVRMDYPHETWLLDDGNRPAMKALADRLGCHYLARENGEDAKAGNLNNALAHAQGDFVAIFDADHAPHRHFLTNTLGYFKDPELAFVQTPQDFYNLDSYQHRLDPDRKQLWTEQSLFFRVILRGKDHWNAAFFCGSCAISRRSCLDDIGGFATGTVTEDLHTSIRLHERGYRSVYHAEPLAFGIAAIDPEGFLKQRLRWGQGAMQVWRRERVLTNPGLTWIQRLNYFASMLTYFDGWQRAIFYAIPAVVLVTGILPISVSVTEFLIIFIPYMLLSFWAFEELTRGYGRTTIIEQYNFARFAIFARATLGLFRRHLTFRVTHKSRLPEQDGRPQPLRVQWFLLAFNALAIPAGIALFFQYEHLPRDALIANVLWAGLLIAIAISLFRYTARNASYRRAEYRFPVPVAMSVTLPGEAPRLLTVDDLSPTGCRAYGALPSGSDPESPLECSLHLPGGPLPIRATVRFSHNETAPDGEHYSRIHGLQFAELESPVEERLETFLHGNDLQWHVRGYSEQSRTPLMRLAECGKEHPDAEISPAVAFGRHLASIRYWSACECRFPVQYDDEIFYGVVTVETPEDIPPYLLVNRPLIAGGHVEIHTRPYQSGTRVLHASVGDSRLLATADGPVHLYRLHLQKEATSCPQPADTIAASA
ncbi:MULTISPECIES: glycosyltransferase [unclassified Thioalkalivibrio]|uniref:glycosyltransferase n=1 Tax=unclassified Thioalkalivibrio TaxID=2621013 RepID=UPI0003705F98|nr:MULTISPECIES: glycosyltransferase [unclassified Thioalkalivibrio]